MEVCYLYVCVCVCVNEVQVWWDNQGKWVIGDSCVIGAMVDGNVCIVSAVNDGSCSLRWSDVQL